MSEVREWVIVNKTVVDGPRTDGKLTTVVEKSALDQAQAEIARLTTAYSQAVKDAIFVLEGSVSRDGQPEEELELREHALERLFDAAAALKGE